MIPSTFTEETELLSDSNLNILKRHYMTFYWKVRKDFLNFVEDSMSNDSLIGFKISTRSKKSVSCASKISSPSVLSHDSKISKVSEKSNPHYFYSKNFNHTFYPKLTLRDTGTMLRMNLKKIIIILVKSSIKSQTILVPLSKWSRKEYRQCQLEMMKGAKYYLQKSFGTEA
jgi:hypothetical protein